MELTRSPKHLGAQSSGPYVRAQGSSPSARHAAHFRGHPQAAALAVTLCPRLGRREHSFLLRILQLPPDSSPGFHRPLERHSSAFPPTCPPSSLSFCSSGSRGSSTALSSLPFPSASECSAHHLITETCPGQPRLPLPLTWVYFPQSTAHHLASAGNPLICEFLVPSYTSITQIMDL